MDLTFLTTAISTALIPFLSKSGEKVAEKIGEEIYPSIKSLFLKDEEKKTLEKLEVSPSPTNFKLFEQHLTTILENSPDIAQTLAELLKMTPTKSVRLENILSSYKEIRDELVFLYVERNNAGIATEGDYSNRIFLQERKLFKLEKDFFKVIKI